MRSAGRLATLAEYFRRGRCLHPPLQVQLTLIYKKPPRAVKHGAVDLFSYELALVVHGHVGDGRSNSGIEAVVDGQSAVNDGSIHSVVLLLGELVELAGLHGQANAVLGSAQLGLLAGRRTGWTPPGR